MNNTTVKQPVALACVLIWLGFICAISFMEAWLKFQAPGITLALGLGIGRLVFQTLNRIEWVFAIVVLASAFLYAKSESSKPHWILAITIGVLIMQTGWLLPGLDARAELYINHLPVPPSSLHIYYVVCEVVKAFCLITSAILYFQRS